LHLFLFTEIVAQSKLTVHSGSGAKTGKVLLVITQQQANPVPFKQYLVEQTGEV
jgi:hypothetical protein